MASNSALEWRRTEDESLTRDAQTRQVVVVQTARTEHLLHRWRRTVGLPQVELQTEAAVRLEPPVVDAVRRDVRWGVGPRSVRGCDVVPGRLDHLAERRSAGYQGIEGEQTDTLWQDAVAGVEVVLPYRRGAVDVEDLCGALVAERESGPHGQPDVRIDSLGVADREVGGPERACEGIDGLAV